MQCIKKEQYKLQFFRVEMLILAVFSGYCYIYGAPSLPC